MKSEDKKRMSWMDVSLNQFNKLQDALKIEDETERTIAICEVIFGENVTDLPLSEFKDKAKELAFLGEEIPQMTPPKTINIHGKKYKVDCLLGRISTAQYVDYINHMKGNEMNKMLSVFLIPDGHKYNDGYDMLEVFNDIDDLPIPIVNGCAFFFENQYRLFMRIFQRYSKRSIRKTKLPKGMKKAMEQVVDSSVDMVLSPIS